MPRMRHFWNHRRKSTYRRARKAEGGGRLLFSSLLLLETTPPIVPAQSGCWVASIKRRSEELFFSEKNYSAVRLDANRKRSRSSRPTIQIPSPNLKFVCADRRATTRDRPTNRLEYRPRRGLPMNSRRFQPADHDANQSPNPDGVDESGRPRQGRQN